MCCAENIMAMNVLPHERIISLQSKKIGTLKLMPSTEFFSAYDVDKYY